MVQMNEILLEKVGGIDSIITYAYFLRQEIL